MQRPPARPRFAPAFYKVKGFLLNGLKPDFRMNRMQILKGRSPLASFYISLYRA